MFDTYILPVLIFAGIGLLAGTLLTVASKIFEADMPDVPTMQTR